MSAAGVVPFRRRAPEEPRECIDCHVPLAPEAPSWWARCPRCFADQLLFRAIRIRQAVQQEPPLQAAPPRLEVAFSC